MSFEIKKVAIQEEPKHFVGNTLLNRRRANKIKSALFCIIYKISKSQELSSGDLKVDDFSEFLCGLQCSTVEQSSSVIAPEESLKNLDTLPRSDCLPLDKQGHVMWPFHGPENATPHSSEGKSSDIHCQTMKTEFNTEPYSTS